VAGLALVAPGTAAADDDVADPAVVAGQDVAAQRAAIQQQLAETGNAAAVARQVEADALRQVAELDAALDSQRAQLDSARQASATAKDQAATAEADAAVATTKLEDQHDLLRQAVVDMFINLPAEDELQLMLTVDAAQVQVAEGLLAGRADVRQGIVDDYQRAQEQANRRARTARVAAAKADDAQAQEEDAVAELARQQAERAGQLAQVRSRLAALEAEVGVLVGQDAELAQRLSAETLATTGSLAVTVKVDGTWTVTPAGLPARTDMVQVPGTTLWVHTLIGGPVAKLVADAAAAGVALDGGAYRDTTEQIALRQAHCGPGYDAVFNAPAASCSPPTARPGRSMHERGLAIDFDHCSSRDTPCYTWLAKNAARYGLFNLPSEPWHWSVNGQ
jgi:Tfp pilus assembly protein PilO